MALRKLRLCVTCGSIYSNFFSCSIGHLYFFLLKVCPEQYGREIVVTPKFLVNMLGDGAPPPPMQGEAPV